MPRFNRRDAKLSVTRALPGSATTVYSSGLDMGQSSKGDFLAEMELLISAPACAVGELANSGTNTYFLQDSDASDFGTVRALSGVLITQTGTGGAGDAAATRRFRPPTDLKRYVRLGVTKTGTGDASGKTATLEILT